MNHALRAVLTSRRADLVKKVARLKPGNEENRMIDDKRNLECEIMAFENRQKIWRKVSCSDRIAQDPDEHRRCPECHGRVVVMKAGNGMPAHFEHRPKHDGCSHSYQFDGNPRPNPKPLE